jgi:hypothetical protein
MHVKCKLKPKPNKQAATINGELYPTPNNNE